MVTPGHPRISKFFDNEAFHIKPFWMTLFASQWLNFAENFRNCEKLVHCKKRFCVLVSWTSMVMLSELTGHYNLTKWVLRTSTWIWTLKLKIACLNNEKKGFQSTFVYDACAEALTSALVQLWIEDEGQPFRKTGMPGSQVLQTTNTASNCLILWRSSTTLHRSLPTVLK